MKYWWSFWYAVAFLTRLPTPKLKRVDEPVAAASLLFYPLVGILIGILLVLLVMICYFHNPEASTLLVAAMVLVFWTLLTGGLHLDGLADTLDAWIGGLGDKDKTLAIMKDPYAGPMGVVGVVLVLLLKWAALAALLQQSALDGGNHWLLLSLVLIPALSRAAAVGWLATTPYVRDQGLGSDLRAGANGMALLIISVPLVFLSVTVLQQQAVSIVLMWLVVNLWLRQLMMQRLGGCTGDTLGAVIECQEALLLAALVL